MTRGAPKKGSGWSLVLAACGVAACSSAASGGHAPPDAAAASDADVDLDVDGAADAAEVATPRAGQWSWVDVPGSACDDGSPTGIAVNAGPGADVLVFFEGGGACWDYTSCFVVNSAAHGPFGRGEWDAVAPDVNVGPFDRTRATNPFRDWSFVFIPYCTGDLHAGDNIQAYQGPLDTRTMHHVGRKNAEGALASVAARWPTPARVVVSGTSAGGFGATFNYDLFRQAFPAAQMALLDDAGPLLEGSGIPDDIRANWYAHWHLGEVVDPLCAACASDLSGLTAALAAKHPNDRLALLSALTDPVISLYFRLSLDQFQSSLLATVAHRYTPTPNARAYLVTSTQHGFLSASATTTSAGVALEAWLTALVGGGPWDAVSP